MPLLRTCQNCGAAMTPGAPCPRCHGQRRIPRACTRCSKPTTTGELCTNCVKELDADRNAGRPHYQGSYKRRAARLRARADADPETRCAICGGKKRPGRGGRWTAHHVDAGNPESPLKPAHADCNERLGNRTG